jgi:hypothetical protein
MDPLKTIRRIRPQGLIISSMIHPRPGDSRATPNIPRAKEDIVTMKDTTLLKKV